MITLDLFESAPDNNPKQPGRVEKPVIPGTDKTAKSGYYPKPADPVQKLAEPTNKFDKVTKEDVAETAGVTDYNPASQGGTRKELIAKYHKTKNPKDAEAARKAGATQKELQGVAEGSLEEITRRDLLKGAGAAAVAGAAGGAKADRSWNKDELSQQFVGTMTSETFRGAVLTWKDEGKDFFLNLREPENMSAYNLEKNRLYYPKITSPKFQIKFGDEQPISSTGQIYTFPLRQLGNYTGYGMVLARGATFDKWRNSFINADKVVMRLEIDGQPTTMVFHDNPAHIQQRQQQRQQEENTRAKEIQKQKLIDEVISVKGLITSAIVSALSLPPESAESKNLMALIKYFTQYMPGIPEQIQYIKQQYQNKDEIGNVSRDQWILYAPKVTKELQDYKNKIEAYGVKESVEQGVAEAQPEPEQQQMDANRRAALRREREPEGSEKIDARLAQQHAQRQEYEKTGKFWLKQKDTQEHISDAFTGKAAANAAALELLKQRPELRGNLVITAYGPDEQQSVKEAATRFPYPEGSENLGRANMEVLIRAYSTPTSERTTLYFGDKAVELDRNDIEAIAEYYDDKLPTNEARWNFIRAVMNNYDNFQNMLNKIGRRSAAAVRQPGLFQEADKKKDDDDLGKVRDVALQRAISKAKADFPTAGSGLEALAKDFMKSQEQDRRDFDQLQTAKRRHDQLLSQISKVDNEQAQEINDLENQNSVMSQRLQQLQNVNAELEKKLSAMTGRREKRQTSKVPSGSSSASTVSAPTIVAPKPAAKKRIKKQAAPKSKAIKVRPSAAIGSIATQLAPQAAPQLAAPDEGDVLPPMFGRSTNPELQRGKETATDTEFRDMPIMRGAAPQAQAQATAEGQNKKEPEVDYDDPRWDAMVSRVGKLAKAGPLKTVWDPVKRVYKNVPASDNKKPVKEQEPSAQGRDAMKNVSDWAERLRVAHELQKDVKLMADPEAKAAVQQRVKDLLAHGIKQGYVK